MTSVSGTHRTRLLILITVLQFSAPSLKFDGRWYWYYNSGLSAQFVPTYVQGLTAAVSSFF